MCDAAGFAKHWAAMTQGFSIGGVSIGGRVLTAPMTGVSDLPFRRAAFLEHHRIDRDSGGRGARQNQRKTVKRPLADNAGHRDAEAALFVNRSGFAARRLFLLAILVTPRLHAARAASERRCQRMSLAALRAWP